MQPEERRMIGIDLGGTGISFMDMYSPDKVVRSLKINTPSSQREIIATLKTQLKQSVSEDGHPAPAGVGIAVAGQVSREGKSVIFSPNLPFKTEYPLGRELEDALGIPVVIENDANAAAIGENIFGEARGLSDFILLTLGTGIGSGIFSGGRLLRGYAGSGGEAGHIPLQPGGPSCGCGQRGCLEALASGTAIGRAYLEKTGEDKTAKEICALASVSESRAISVLSSAGEWLGVGLVALVNLFNPAAVFFAGSLAHAPRCYFEPALKIARERSFGTSGKDLILKVSAFADNIGVIGAAALPLLDMRD